MLSSVTFIAASQGRKPPVQAAFCMMGNDSKILNALSLDGMGTNTAAISDPVLDSIFKNTEQT